MPINIRTRLCYLKHQFDILKRRVISISDPKWLSVELRVPRLKRATKATGGGDKLGGPALGARCPFLLAPEGDGDAAASLGSRHASEAELHGDNEVRDETNHGRAVQICRFQGLPNGAVNAASVVACCEVTRSQNLGDGPSVRHDP